MEDVRVEADHRRFLRVGQREAEGKAQDRADIWTCK
jgi:hypothetical protein